MPKLTQDFLDEIDALRNTFQLSVEEDTYDASSFGDAILVLTGPKVQVRLSRDRGQLFVELAPAGQSYRWEYINKIFESLGISHRHDPNSRLAQTIQMLVDRREQIMAFIQDNKASWPAPRIRPSL